jgi:hypothetical protein
MPLLGSRSSSSAVKGVPIRRSIDETYRHYRLIAGQRGDGFSAIAYAGNVRVFTGSGSDLDGALDDLKMQIDRDFDRRVGQREGEQPSQEELELALSLASRKITPPLRHLLDVLNAAPEVSLQQVQRRSGVDRGILLRDLVRLSRALADILGVTLPKGSSNASSALSLVTESMRPAGETDEIWTFRPAFIAAAGDRSTR